MFLSNRDIKWAIACGKLIVDPPPETDFSTYDQTAIDLHLGSIAAARIWDVDGLKEKRAATGGRKDNEIPEVHIGDITLSFIKSNQIPVPEKSPDSLMAASQLVYRRGDEVFVRKFGFLLWTTREKVGTPRVDPDLGDTPQRHPELICFVNAKSTRARTGLLVHFTAPTIHAGWDGNITLEIANLGPFTFVLKEGDPLAQLTVATISSAPDITMQKTRSQTQGQIDPTGRPNGVG
ncbi:MAG: dCTP deaminase [Gemmataceae bacterium]